MPKLKQPSSLVNVAMDVLVGSLTSRYDEVSSSDMVDKQYEVIAYMKCEICPHIPWPLSAEFYKKFFAEYKNFYEMESRLCTRIDENIILELIMDGRIRGLICEGPVMEYLNPSDVHRFQGLMRLDLTYCRLSRKVNLANFHLQDLTEFIFAENCTNSHLRVIGQNCPKLISLMVTESKAVTDRGLSCLHSCSKLRFVCVAFCRISYSGISKLLSANTKIEILSAWTNSMEPGFDCFSNCDLSVHPSINNFTIVSNRISDKHLQSVVIKFPNLTLFGVCGHITGDLCMLKSLSKLSRLDFRDAVDFRWDNLRKLLTFIGDNISELRMCCGARYTSCMTQSDFDFVFQTCGNIVNLEFDYCPMSEGEILVVPPFKKMKYLSCHIPAEYGRRMAVLEFGQMLELENLMNNSFHMTADTVISMILDKDKFPNLKSMAVPEISGRHKSIDKINRVARNNNLDFKILEMPYLRQYQV